MNKKTVSKIDKKKKTKVTTKKVNSTDKKIKAKDNKPNRQAKTVVKKSTSVKNKTASKQPLTKPTIKKPAKEPTTMAELIKSTGYSLHGLKRGQKVKGKITEINKRHILIDIGAKTEGIVTSKEYEFVKDYTSGLKVGDEIEALVGSPENEKGQILLSLKKAASDYKWETFEQYYKSKEAVEVRALETNKGGVIARHKGVRGFIPSSQFGREWLGRLRELQNKIISVKVIEVDRSKNRLIFSERLVSEEKAIKNQQQALDLVKTDEVYEGIVSGIMPFGVFIRVNVENKAKSSKKAKAKAKAKDQNESLFLEGLVHISEVSWQKVSDLNKMFKVGQKLKVKVLSINKESGKLNLSIKQLEPDPWEDLAKKYKKDVKVEGTVSKLAAFGAFVALEEGVEGLLHISKIPADYAMKTGDKINVYIESIDIKNKKISLGLVLKSKPVGYK